MKCLYCDTEIEMHERFTKNRRSCPECDFDLAYIGCGNLFNSYWLPRELRAKELVNGWIKIPEGCLLVMSGEELR